MRKQLNDFKADSIRHWLTRTHLERICKIRKGFGRLVCQQRKELSDDITDLVQVFAAHVPSQ